MTETGQPFIISASGTLGWDMVAANLVEPGEDVLVLNTGFFGDRSVQGVFLCVYRAAGKSRVAGNRIWKFFITYIPYIYPVYTPYTVETVYIKNPIFPNQTPRGVIA